MIRKLWTTCRRFIPVSLYPMLAPLYQWERQRAISRMQASDMQYRQDHPDVVVPDAVLRYNAAGESDIPNFLKSGHRTADDVERALGNVSTSVEPIQKALDFGCGCGRFLIEATRRWPHIEWCGADVDQRATEWCARHLAGATILVSAPMPPLRLPDEEFQLVWCGSVFTHLDEDYQDAWLRELCRVLAPDGYLLASVHGSNCWADLPERDTQRIRERGFSFARTAGDAGIHPEWYQAAWHTQEYVERHWSEFAPVVAYFPRGFNSYQDIVVCRKRPQ